MLGITPERFWQSPWWRQQLILQGITWELENGGIYTRAGGSHPSSGSGGGGQREFADLSAATDAELAQLGIQQW